MRNALTIFLILAAAVGGWFVGTKNTPLSAPTETSVEVAEPSLATKTPVRGIGKLEPHSGVLKIMAPVGQRIESLYDLQIGDSVDIDQPIVKLAGRERAELELKLALAKQEDARKKESFEKSQGMLQKQAAELALAEAKSGADEVESKGTGIELLKAQLRTADSTLQNLRNLKSNPATRRLVGQSDIDKQQLLVQQIETKIAQSEDEIRLANQKIERAQQAAQLDIDRVESLLSNSALPENSMNAAIEAAEKAVEMLEIKSPIDGAVLDVVVRPGDTATNQPVMLIGDTTSMVCVAEINDSGMLKVEVGTSATITSSAFESPLTGTVISKGVMIGPPSMKDPNPFASVDRKAGQVVIALDTSDVAASFVNLQVDVEIKAAGATAVRLD